MNSTPGSVSPYQPYWAVRAHLLQTLNRTQEAAVASVRAIGLAEDVAVRHFLLERRADERLRLARVGNRLPGTSLGM